MYSKAENIRFNCTQVSAIISVSGNAHTDHWYQNMYLVENVIQGTALEK
jgi:hypothetical protein